MKKIPTDDKVQIAGIAITDSDVCAYLSDMTGRSRGGDRQSLDGSRSHRLAGLCLLHQKFIDIEVTVNLPDGWLSSSAHASVDQFLGDSIYDKHR